MEKAECGEGESTNFERRNLNDYLLTGLVT